MAYYRRIRDMREDHIPTVTLIQLSDLYHTSTDYLLGRIENPEFPKT